MKSTVQISYGKGADVDGWKKGAILYTYSGYTATINKWAYLLGDMWAERLRERIAKYGAETVFGGRYGPYVADAGARKRRAELGIVLQGVDDEQHTGRESQESMSGVA